MYFVGYCPNGYKLWNLEDRKIVFGRDPVFDVTKFSFDGFSSEEWIHYKENEDFNDEENEYFSDERNENFNDEQELRTHEFLTPEQIQEEVGNNKEA